VEFRTRCGPRDTRPAIFVADFIVTWSTSSLPYNQGILLPWTMTSVLDKIVAATRTRVAKAKRSTDLRDLEQRSERHVPRGFRRALENAHLWQNRPEVGHPGIAVIAELKKASPSKGLIRAEFHAAGLARELEDAGAAALSVLTDEKFFQGSLRNLQEASATVKLPCLRKDFIVDQFQLVEARANAADAVLLIVAALTPEELRKLVASAGQHELDVLCEVHDGDELDRALEAGCDLIGVNTRDLRTFQVNLETAFRLAEKIPAGVVRVAESGIHSAEDVARLRAAGYDAFLVGESLMRAERPGEALRELMRVPSREYRVPSGR
jgi:indole-3-glycerol phosphate synthase